MSKGKPLGICRTCRSEIVQSVSNGVFVAGECDACERLRYENKPQLLAALENLVELADSVAGNWESGSLAEAVRGLARSADEAREVVRRAGLRA